MVIFVSVSFSVQTNCGYSSINWHSGRFTSPNYPSNYGHHQNCYWTLTSNTRITLSFESFLTEGNYDYVRVYDGYSTSHASLGQFSGSIGPQSVSSSSNQMHITFQTDHSGTRQGFSAIYDGKIQYTIKCYIIENYLSGRLPKVF